MKKYTLHFFLLFYTMRYQREFFDSKVKTFIGGIIMNDTIKKIVLCSMVLFGAGLIASDYAEARGRSKGKARAGKSSARAGRGGKSGGRSSGRSGGGRTTAARSGSGGSAAGAKVSADAVTKDDCKIYAKYNYKACKDNSFCYDDSADINYCGDEPDYKGDFFTCAAAKCKAVASTKFVAANDFSFSYADKAAAGLSAEDPDWKLDAKNAFGCVSINPSDFTIATDATSRDRAKSECEDELDVFNTDGEKVAVRAEFDRMIDNASRDLLSRFNSFKSTQCASRKAACVAAGGNNYTPSSDRCFYKYRSCSGILFWKKCSDKEEDKGDFGLAHWKGKCA